MSILLKSPLESLVLSTTSTSEISYSVEYGVILRGETTATTTEGLIVTATSTTIVEYPSPNYKFDITSVYIVNNGVAGNVVQITKLINSVVYPLLATDITLSPGEYLQYNTTQGWRRYNATGEFMTVGATGANGLSAYEVAVANGFVGTEAAWLASLVGADGVVQSIVAGTNITVDNTDPANPIVSATASSSVAWGDITGTLSDQTDLQNELDLKEDLVNKAIDFSVVNNTLYPTTEAVNNQIISSMAGLTAYFFYNTASSIPTYLQMTSVVSSGALQTITNAGVVNNQLLTTFATNAGSPNLTFIPSGVVRFHLHAHKTAGTKVTQLYARLYYRNLAGTETLITTTLYTEVIAGIDAEYSTDGTIPSPIILLSTDRLVVKIYAYCPGGGSAPTIELNIEDATAARVELPSSPVNLSNYFDKLTDDTDDITEGANKFVTAADLVILANTSGVNTGDQNLTPYFNKSVDDTDDITEGITNLFWSNPRTIASVLTGLSVTGSAIISTDTILQAFGKAQNQINALVGGVNYQGSWNALTNTPALVSSVGTKGYYYVVSVAGTTNLDGITDWALGDWAIFNGTVWQKIDNTDAVISVNGYGGIVVLTTADIADSTNNRYVTDAQLVVIGNTSGTNTGDQTNISGNAATVTTNANLSGPVTSVGNTTAIANGAISNAMLANAAVSDLTGSNSGDNAPNTLYSGLVSGPTYATGTSALNFGVEENNVVNTISYATVTAANFKGITFLPTSTTETSLDDFTLNGVTFAIENIVDGVSFDIRASAVNSASGTYTIKYQIATS